MCSGCRQRGPFVENAGEIGADACRVPLQLARVDRDAHYDRRLMTASV